MAKICPLEVPYLDSVSYNYLNKNAKSCRVLFTHCNNTSPITESDASTAILMSALMFCCAGNVAIISLDKKNAFFIVVQIDVFLIPTKLVYYGSYKRRAIRCKPSVRTNQAAECAQLLDCNRF